LAVLTEYGEYPCFAHIVLHSAGDGWDKPNSKNKGDELCGMVVFINSIDAAVDAACSGWESVFRRLDIELSVTVSLHLIKVP
jgi:hypothetical protein